MRPSSLWLPAWPGAVWSCSAAVDHPWCSKGKYDSIFSCVTSTWKISRKSRTLDESDSPFLFKSFPTVFVKSRLLIFFCWKITSNKTESQNNRKPNKESLKSEGIARWGKRTIHTELREVRLVEPCFPSQRGVVDNDWVLVGVSDKDVGKAHLLPSGTNSSPVSSSWKCDAC